MRKAVIAIAVLAASLVAATSATPAPATTSPGYNFTIAVKLTDTGVTLSRSVAKRGWRAHFNVTNRGKKTHVFDVGGLKTAPIAPGQTRKLGAFLDDRGKFAYRVDKKVRGYFTVI